MPSNERMWMKQIGESSEVDDHLKEIYLDSDMISNEDINLFLEIFFEIPH